MYIQRTKKTTTRVRELYIIEEKLLTKAIKDIIKKVLNGNIDKFINRHEKNYRYERTYSVTIPLWRKNKQSNKAIEWLLVKCNWPNHVRDVTNIMNTLNQYYNLEINRSNIKKAFIIWVSLYDKEIYPKMHRRYCDEYKDNKGNVRDKQLSPRQARKEFEARGFTKEYKNIINTDFAHVSSTNNKYVWPANFKHGYIKGSEYITDIYVAQSCVGISGYTKCVIPKNN